MTLDPVGRRHGQAARERFSAGGSNPVHAWLDACRIRWRENRGDLIDYYGITRQADRVLDAVELQVSPKPIEGLIRPLYFQASDHFSPHVPPIELFGNAYYARDARINIRRVAEELSVFLGPAAVEDHLNTLRAVWTLGRARVRLLAWPSEKQRPRASWEKEVERDPRVRLGCHITIHTGLLPGTTPAERAQLESFVPIRPLPPARKFGSFDNWHANQGALEFIRDSSPFPQTTGMIGMSSDRSALIFGADDLFILSMASVRGIHVERTRPAKGPGGSLLQVEVLTDYPAMPDKKIIVCEAPGADDLNELGKTIADAIGKPLKLSPYFSDC